MLEPSSVPRCRRLRYVTTPKSTWALLGAVFWAAARQDTRIASDASTATCLTMPGSAFEKSESPGRIRQTAAGCQQPNTFCRFCRSWCTLHTANGWKLRTLLGGPNADHQKRLDSHERRCPAGSR